MGNVTNRKMYGDGKIYYQGGQMFITGKEDFTIDTVIDYYDIEINDYVEVNNFIDKTFTAEWNELVVFKEKEYVYGGIHEIMDWIPEEHEDEYIAILDKDDKFTVLSIDDVYNIYEVQLEDGQVGWIGGLTYYLD
ncbi:MAG: hypothetical protein CVU84_02025 [Firmicutes bacterium HGW-Firmicutes-1]|jgi:hypothetical protein|nr:MAG: hypothetical protein CVU84_02025 [Firmicutes bacterium HGW-Firmicutes-1]